MLVTGLAELAADILAERMMNGTAESCDFDRYRALRARAHYALAAERGWADAPGRQPTTTKRG